jgi:hypothetical protein
LNYAVEPNRTLDILERLRSAFFYYETARRPANQGEETWWQEHLARKPAGRPSQQGRSEGRRKITWCAWSDSI